MKRWRTAPSRSFLLLVLLVASQRVGQAQAPSPTDPGGAEPLLRFGVLADCQYCDAESGGSRRYRLSDEKLAGCVEHLNTLELDFVIHLGDFIDRDWQSFDVVCPVYDRLRAEKYHVLGNHDYSVADERKAEVPRRLGLESRYYHFEKKGLRLVVLDGNDLSFHAYPEGSAPWRRSATYYKASGSTSPKWNGALGLAQLTWLDEILAGATRDRERVLVFCHFPVFPDNAHNLWNAAEVLRLLESHQSFLAYFNGHNHAGNHGRRGDRHYVTLHGMVDTETTSYAVVEVWPDRIELRGFGRQPSRTLSLGTPVEEPAEAGR